MKLKITAAILIVVAVVGTLAGIKVRQIQKLMAAGKAFSPPPELVSCVTVQEEQWQRTLTAIGTVTAVQGVTVTPDIPGTVREIAFESGAVVAKGDLLVRLDTSSEEAQLRAVEAQVDWAKISLARARSLRADNTVSQAEVDAAEATLKQNQANGDTIRATIEKKTIRAPFAGRLGIRQINLGQYLEAGRPIVSLQSLVPVHVDFSLPQQDLAKLATAMRVRLATDAYPERAFEGALTAITPELDQGTRSVGLQATFENKDLALRPGMFVRAEVLLPGDQSVLVIPATAVLSAPYGSSVYVVEAKPGKDGKPALKTRQQFIKTGSARGDYVSVVSGLKPGERIVSSGVFKLRNDLPVVESNEVAPKRGMAPKPADS